MLKEITLDFSTKEDRFYIPEIALIKIQYPSTPSLVIITIENHSSKWLEFKFTPKSATFESVLLAPGGDSKKDDISMELHFNRNNSIKIAINEKSPPRWCAEQ